MYTNFRYSYLLHVSTMEKYVKSIGYGDVQNSKGINRIDIPIFLFIK